MEDIIKDVMNEAMHGVTFEYQGIQYIISGYWMIEGYRDAFDPQAEGIEGTYHFYDKKEDLIRAKIFGSKSLIDIEDKVKILEVFNDW